MAQAQRRLPSQRRRAPLPLPVLDGPDPIQLRPVRDASRAVLREPIAEPSEWRDPDDHTNANTAAGRLPRVVRGWRRTCAILRMHAANPQQVTSRHVDAAARFQDDHEIRLGVSRGPRLVERVDGGGPGQPIVTRAVQAGIRVDRCKAAVGAGAYAVLFRVTVCNWTIGHLARTLGTSPVMTTGRIHAALDRLLEHYADSA